ncbi:double-stranded RNA-binding protein 5 isoform X1 [Cryptomeria japonica]|uniref:double-stranded RNA-binding protein 5 isoform X1 n=2 Tax=Cryptomeria japonica TaxID=3369 RepID=UPI0027DA7405|nr:double-stranded RNA-binding protein 5 isoform X1 [Cryptomeria japonica]
MQGSLHLRSGAQKCHFIAMYKNQLQELAQRSCFNLPSYSCIREGPDHAPRFKATVNFNGEVFESPNYCSTLRQAEHAAAEVALSTLSKRGPSQSLAARILDETGVYKNLLQEIAQRAGAPLPVYTTVRSGLGHLPVFTCTVELAGINFTGEPAKNKKQAEKNAAMAAWSSLRQLPHQSGFSSVEGDGNEEQEQITIARALSSHRHKELTFSRQSKQQHSGARRRMLAQRESGSHSFEQQSFGGGGSQWVSPDMSLDGCSRFSSNQNQHHQQNLHLTASPSSGSKILPFIRSIFPQRNRSGSLHDSSSASSMSREAIAANRAAAAAASGSNSRNEPLVLALTRESVAANRTSSNIRTVHRPTSQQASLPLEEHERDEDEWLRGDFPRESKAAILGISNLAEWASAFASTNSLPWANSAQSWNFNRQQQQQQHQQLMQQSISQPVSSFGGLGCRATPSSMAAPPVRIRTAIPVCADPPQRRSCSEFVGNDANLVPPTMLSAPAVRIRSAIPVFSAPPPRRPLPQTPNRISVEEEDSTLQLLNRLRF